MLVEYIPIAILFVVASAIAVLVIVLGTVLGPRRKSFRKQSPYESGMMPIGPAPAACRSVLSRRRPLHPVRRRSDFLLSVGGQFPRAGFVWLY